MILKLFLAFTIIPVVELYLLIEIGSVIGSLNTVLIIILSGISGAYLARMQGMNTMVKLQKSLQQGIMPKEEIIDGIIIFVAGIVLITPGFVTDITGLLLLFPATRNVFKRFIRSKIDSLISNKTINIRKYP